MTEPQTLDLQELEKDYAIGREIGRGGMGVVYRARHRTAGHEVAIKVVHTKYLTDKETTARLEREARLAARMQHPNIVRHYEMRRLAPGHVALVMQFVPGDTLSTMLRKGTGLAYADCERVLRDVATALEFAHGSGVVHRDVKPDNIFIDRQSGRALLSDFGIAKAILGDSDLTLTGAAIGTPTYMAPEQIDGKNVDARSDIYSLGIVGWEMLSGQRPWDGESLFTVIYNQKHRSLPPLSNYRNDIPQRLVLALDGALEKHPDLRWASATDFLQQLGQNAPTQKALKRRELAASSRGAGDPMDAATVTFRRKPGEEAKEPRPAVAPAGPSAPTPSPSPARLPATPLAPPRGPRSTPSWWVIGIALLAIGGALGGLATLLVIPYREAARGDLTTVPNDPENAIRSGSSTASAGPSRVQPAPPAASAPALQTPVEKEGPRNAPAPVVALPASPATPRVVGPASRMFDAESRARASRSDNFVQLARERFKKLQFAPAMDALDSALTTNPTNAHAYALRARVRLGRGDLRNAWADAEVSQRLGRDWESACIVAMIEARARDSTSARRRVGTLLRTARRPEVRLTPEQGGHLALALLAIGDTSSAFEVLERIESLGSPLGRALEDPGFASVRASNRFKRLARSEPGA